MIANFEDIPSILLFDFLTSISISNLSQCSKFLFSVYSKDKFIVNNLIVHRNGGIRDDPRISMSTSPLKFLYLVERASLERQRFLNYTVSWYDHEDDAHEEGIFEFHRKTIWIRRPHKGAADRSLSCTGLPEKGLIDVASSSNDNLSILVAIIGTYDNPEIWTKGCFKISKFDATRAQKILGRKIPQLHSICAHTHHNAWCSVAWGKVNLNTEKPIRFTNVFASVVHVWLLSADGRPWRWSVHDKKPLGPYLAEGWQCVPPIVKVSVGHYKSAILLGSDGRLFRYGEFYEDQANRVNYNSLREFALQGRKGPETLCADVSWSGRHGIARELETNMLFSWGWDQGKGVLAQQGYLVGAYSQAYPVNVYATCKTPPTVSIKKLPVSPISRIEAFTQSVDLIDVTYTCALTDKGDLYVVGDNNIGQLGVPRQEYCVHTSADLHLLDHPCFFTSANLRVGNRLQPTQIEHLLCTPTFLMGIRPDGLLEMAGVSNQPIRMLDGTTDRGYLLPAMASKNVFQPWLPVEKVSKRPITQFIFLLAEQLRQQTPEKGDTEKNLYVNSRNNPSKQPSPEFIQDMLEKYQNRLVMLRNQLEVDEIGQFYLE
eukprot:Platyproteum_vivax@DN2581_c0_g1_i1.p1